MIYSFKDLIVWQEAMDLVEMTYRITYSFPRDELFALTSQTRRAVTSIPANIAEGNGRNTTKDYLHFLAIAHGSLKELETHILIAERLKYVVRVQTENTLVQIEKVGRLLNALRSSSEKSQNRKTQSPIPNPQSLIPNPQSPIPNP